MAFWFDGKGVCAVFSFAQSEAPIAFCVRSSGRADYFPLFFILVTTLFFPRVLFGRNGGQHHLPSGRGI